MTLLRRTLLGTVLSFTMLQACSGIPEKEMSADLGALYNAPATYQDHRDQQREFASTTGKIAYTDHGTGPVLVLLHGVPTSSWMYRKIIPGLQENMRVITVDHLGFGSSEKPDDGAGLYNARDHAARVEELLTSLNVEEYGLLVHDMGGLVGWELMRDAPGNITHLTVLNTIVNDEGFSQPSMSESPFTRAMMKAYSRPMLSEVVLSKTFSDLGLTGEHELSEAECYGYVAPMREGASPALYAFFTSLDEDLFARLEENKTALSAYRGQTLVMWGAKDETLTVEQVPILKTMLNVPERNIHIYEDNAHFLAEEIPQEIVARVTDLMAN